MVNRGLELRRKGKDAEALAEFRRALQVQRAPRIQAQVALAEQAMGLWKAAEEDLLAATAHGDDQWIQKYRVQLAKALDVIQSHLGTLEVWGTPAGAEVVVNEQTVGRFPLSDSIRVDGGSAVLRVRASGYVEATRLISVPPKEKVREHVQLIPLTATSPLPTKPSPGGTLETINSAVAPEPPAAVPSITSTAAGQDTTAGVNLRPYAWGAAIGAAVGVTVGVVETFAALSKQTEFENHSGPNPAMPTQTIKDCGTAQLTSVCKGIKDAHDRNIKLAITGYVVGGAFAVASVVLFAVSSKEDPATASLACIPDLEHAGVSCRMQF